MTESSKCLNAQNFFLQTKRANLHHYHFFLLHHNLRDDRRIEKIEMEAKIGHALDEIRSNVIFKAHDHQSCKNKWFKIAMDPNFIRSHMSLGFIFELQETQIDFIQNTRISFHFF